MGLTRWYFQVQQHFERKYGDSVVILVQVGKFFEIYEYQPSLDSKQIILDDSVNLKLNLRDQKPEDRIINEIVDSSRPIGKASEISLILNMKLTSKNKGKPHSMDCPLMVGFQPPNYEQHRDLLLLHGYTVIRIDQKDRASDKEDVERIVTEIKSPGTNLDSQITTQLTGSNSIVSLLFQLQKPKGTRTGPDVTKVLCGLSSLDVATGRSTVCEIYSRDEDEIYAVHEVYRFLSAQRPIELIVNLIGDPETVHDYTRYISEQLEIERYPTRIVKCNDLDANFNRDEYQEALFSKAFASSSVIQPGTTQFIYELDLELYQYGRLSYVVLLQYCYEHNEVLIKKLQRPQVGWIDQSKYLILTHNAIDQLDFFSKRTGPLARRTKVIDSLISVVDMTSTPLGSRFLRRQLLNPITDIERLESIYEMTSELIGDSALLNDIDQVLKQLPDIERLQRKIQMEIIKPKELVILFRGYQLVQQVYMYLYSSCFAREEKEALKQLFLPESEIQDFNESVAETLALIDLNKLERVKFTSRVGSKKQTLECDDSFINPGCDPDIDQVQSQLRQYQAYLEAICQHLNECLKGTRTKRIDLTIERNKMNEDGTQLTVSIHTTPSGAKAIRSSQINQQLCGQLEFHEMKAKSKTMITSELIRQVTYGIEFCQGLLEQKLLTKFNEIITKIGQRSYFRSLTDFIMMVDFLKSNAQMSLKYKYYRPVIDRNAHEHFFEMKDLRHPLIERIIRSEYIPNDISLGNGNPLGLLLFGVNSSGKSSRGKAVPSVLSMAQAGLYVPCHLRYYPASRIITRLSGNDDLLGGKSSFVVEATELRTILRNADQNTLVVGDELCRGTETTSGTSLTVQTIATLIKRGAKFIFSTHMHHLPRIDLIREAIQSKTLRIAHLTADYNEATGQIIYGRKLEDGPGSSIYGLEVCKSLGIDRDFIEGANRIRREIEQIPDLFHSTKRSRYGKGILIDRCLICETQLQLQTHHIQEQSTADEKGFIGHYHKDSTFNQIPLCESCHKNLHRLKQQIIPQQTLTGTYLVVQGKQ